MPTGRGMLMVGTHTAPVDAGTDRPRCEGAGLGGGVACAVARGVAGGVLEGALANLGESARGVPGGVFPRCVTGKYLKPISSLGIGRGDGVEGSGTGGRDLSRGGAPDGGAGAREYSTALLSVSGTPLGSARSLAHATLNIGVRAVTGESTYALG